MPKDFRPTALERAIGRQLFEWRDMRLLSLIEAGRRVGFSSAKLSLMENAVQPSVMMDIMALAYAYQVPAEEWQDVARQAQHAEQARTAGVGQGLFDPAEDFPRLVAEASVLRTFTTDLVPSPFQLPDYTKTVLQAENPVRLDQQSRVREAWSERLGGRDPLKVEAVFPESVLRLVVGGRRVMKAQLLHLMDMSGLESVSVKIVPRSAGAYPAMGAPFSLVSFAHRRYNDIAYFETFLKGEYVERPGSTEECARRHGMLCDLALGEDESLECMAEAAAEL